MFFIKNKAGTEVDREIEQDKADAKAGVAETAFKENRCAPAQSHSPHPRLATEGNSRKIRTVMKVEGEKDSRIGEKRSAKLEACGKIRPCERATAEQDSFLRGGRNPLLKPIEDRRNPRSQRDSTAE